MLSGKDLKIIRITKDIKANEVAQHLGIHKSYISKMEKGVCPIPEHIFEKWIEFLENK